MSGSFVRLLLVALGGAAVAACGGTPAAPDSGGRAEDAPRFEDAGPMGESLEVAIVDGSGPVAGATLTAVHASGTSTATTDASGHATLEGVLADDVLHITADGHIPLTFSRLPSRTDTDYFDGGVLSPVLVQRRPTDTVTVRGAFTGGAANGEWWVVTPERARSFAGPGDFEVALARGVETSAAVLEFDLLPEPRHPRAGRNAALTGGRMVTFPAGTTDTTFDIDLAENALPVQTATGSFPIPPAPHALHDTGAGYFTVADLGHPGWFLGESSVVTADAADTRYEYQGNWIEPPEATQPVTAFYVGTERPFVSVIVDGYPTGGAQDVTFLDVPTVVTPELLTPWRVGDVASLEGLAATSEVLINASDEGETETLWFVIAPPGAPVWLPAAPPGGVGASTLTARFVACERDRMLWACRRMAVGSGRTIEL